jgi:hypothetical protein
MVKIKGKPLPPVTDIQPPTIDEMNIIVAKWDANCPPYYKGLMETQPVTMANPTAKFLWDKTTMHYIDRRTGRVLTRKEIKDAFIAYNEKVSGR